jgi:DoxX-like family
VLRRHAVNLYICIDSTILREVSMFAATVVVSALLAAALAYSAAMKLSHRPDVVRSYAAVGVPEDKLNALATLLLAGAAGLLLGLAWAPVGIAAAACLVVYFVVAIGFHIRLGQARTLPTPVVIVVLAAAALALRLATL